MTRLTTRLASVLGMTLALSLLAVDAADARRGGSFGSRGSRTYQAAPPTRTAPQETAPVQRSMTAPSKAGPQGQAPAAGAQAQAPGRRGFFGGMGGGILAGLAAGGLLGMLMGHGFGGMGGLGNMLLQLALLGGGIWLLMMLFRRFRSAPQPAGYPREAAYSDGPPQPFGANRAFEAQAAPQPTTYAPPTDTVEIGVTQADRDAFERLLTEVQDAFGREDYTALRAITTPEIMSYLSEELSQNATQGRRNEVSGTKLLQADISEAWAEGDTEYATAAMRYESTDVMRDRQTGAVVSGDATKPTETTELWTFVRPSGEPWKLSAIQET
jgi:predicted lipid-binding transport protein (Tim44 family)